MGKKKLQVFVSSTYTDLKEERQAAVQAILKAGHIPAGMELFTSGDKSQLQTIYNWIDQSDVYMLILGGRYGSLESESKVSYSEIEYDYARSQGKPSFSVVISDEAINKKVKEFGLSVIETENPKQLQQFRAKVLSNISSFFSDSKDIKLCVHESLADYALDSSLPGWISGSDIPDVSSIQRELEELRVENEELKKKIPRPGRGKDGVEDLGFVEMERILKSIEVIVPQAVLGEDALNDEAWDLNRVFISSGDTLVTGVTSQIGNNDFRKFLYFSVAPKLQIHGLVDNEKIAGVTYRRAFANREGQRYLAWVAKKKLAKGNALGGE